jgi:hypothetical protein
MTERRYPVPSAATIRNARIHETQSCRHCRNFGWHSFMEPMRESFGGPWHHPACPRVAGKDPR